MKIGFLVILIGVLGFACESATHIDKDAVIEEKVKERLDNFKYVIFDLCRKKVLEEAGAMADSIIIERAKLLKDSLLRPEKPNRPEKPTQLELKDSLKLAPLFDPKKIKPTSSTLQEY